MELEKMALFQNISAREREALLSCVSGGTRTFSKGAVILCRGERTDRMGLVLSGRVHIIREDFWGNSSMVGLAEAGDSFAESYALAQMPLEVSAVAAQRSEVLFLHAGSMLTGCGKHCPFHHQLTCNLLGMLARKNLALTTKIRHMARKTTREKLMSYLSEQAWRAGTSAFEIPLDRQQLADFLSVDRSAMSAALGKLRDEGVLEFHRNRFRLLRPDEEDEPC